MRIKVVALILLAGALAVSLMLTIRINHSSHYQSPSALASAPQMAPASDPGPAILPHKTIKPVQPDPAKASPAASQEYEDYVDNRIVELQETAMRDDRDSLTAITSELDNRDPRIRKAALEAAIQFGSRDAIPKLADVAQQTDDPKEKAALLEAVEFLKLPSLSEEIAQRKSQPTAQARTIKPVRSVIPARPTPAPASP